MLLQQYRISHRFKNCMHKSKGKIRVYGNICGEIKSEEIPLILKMNQFLNIYCQTKEFFTNYVTKNKIL